tara:strand:- start:200843 stop:201142 length:300 start_codon:yes stop_codon:yes gene_type:complete
MSENQQWLPCPKPEIGDVLKWTEPLWAAPTKPRGKRDKIGEQQITAELLTATDVFELKVLSVEKLSGDDTPLQVQIDEEIKRKRKSIALGDCHKAAASA